MRFYIGFMSILCVLVVAFPGYCENTAKEDKDPVFSYDITGKIDPFKPFIEGTKRKGMEKEKKRTTPLSPLEKYDINDLKLVGIAETGNGKKIAMVEDGEGKFYPIVSGALVGMNGGRVSQIKDNQIIIIEEITDFAGKRKTKERIMKLKEKSEEEL